MREAVQEAVLEAVQEAARMCWDRPKSEVMRLVSCGVLLPL